LFFNFLVHFQQALSLLPGSSSYDLHHLYWSVDGNWNRQNISQSLQLLPLSLEAGVLASEGAAQLTVYVVDRNGDLHELSAKHYSTNASYVWTKNENAHTLPKIARLLTLSSQPLNERATPATVLYFLGTDRHLYQLESGYLSAGDWRCTDINEQLLKYLVESKSSSLSTSSSTVEWTPTGAIDAVCHGMLNAIARSTTELMTHTFSGVWDASAASARYLSDMAINGRRQKPIHVEGEVDVIEGEEFLLMKVPGSDSGKNNDVHKPMAPPLLLEDDLPGVPRASRPHDASQDLIDLAADGVNNNNQQLPTNSNDHIYTDSDAVNPLSSSIYPEINMEEFTNQ
jgi:hypothetical protein